ncbi:hypothetical protein GOP47_0025485 [Adiantum capillus-veneris]|uniref:Uncharacterized protein n=1 Tax=Adiantum capillus-veneris TaxID=13818 RepID=A0A9D4U0A1_ADICA|nr:hypothetical protein GOP47_0025485 [Adiantum capillus-veneris]
MQLRSPVFRVHCTFALPEKETADTGSSTLHESRTSPVIVGELPPPPSFIVEASHRHSGWPTITL